MVQIEDIWYSAWKIKRESGETEEEIDADVDTSISPSFHLAYIVYTPSVFSDK